jgi:hypothetical protein
MDLKIRLRVLQIVEPKLGHGLAMAHSWLNKITWLRLCDAFPRAKRVHRELLRPPIIAVDAIKASSPNPPEPHVELIDGGYCANNPTLYAIADAMVALKIPSDRLRVVSVGVGVYPQPKPRPFTKMWFARYLQSVERSKRRWR